MPEVSVLSPAASILVVLAVLVGGAYAVATLEGITAAIMARRSPAVAVLEPLRVGALLLRQQRSTTERPDALLWSIAPAGYASAAALAMTVVPLGEGVAVADVRTGIVLFGAAEALAIVAVFLHGWSSNSHLSLIGGYRFVALALSYELLSMFVLIAAALPAESLQVSAIVASQAELWNVVRQPLGLPLWLVVTAGITFTGPLNVAEGKDLAGGTTLEVSGRPLLLWKVARGGMLTVFSAMGASVFLGGWHGPWLPGWVWILAKTLMLIVLVSWLGQRFGRISCERLVTALWTIGLPLAFVGLVAAGLEAMR